LWAFLSGFIGKPFPRKKVKCAEKGDSTDSLYQDAADMEDDKDLIFLSQNDE
jgi:hypothetical protein